MNKDEAIPDIVKKDPPSKPPIKLRYVRGLILLSEIGVFAALPFMFLMLGFILHPGMIWWGFAVASLLGAPVLAYDSFAASTQKKMQAWFEDEKAKD